MSDLGRFDWTTRARPIVELGVGDTRIPVGTATWDTARWDNPAAIWAGTEPVWHDITCDTLSYRCEYGRQRVTERFIPGTATVIVRNLTGWADPNTTPDTGVLSVRPGRAIRVGVVHQVHGIRWLYRGFVDAMNPTYDPVELDMVELSCVDALGEVNRAKFPPYPDPVGAGETVSARINRILDLAQWPTVKRVVPWATSTLIAHDMGGQAADLIGQAADSAGGAVFGDRDANIVYRPRDWQTFPAGSPPDGTIGNVAAGDVCPVRWERPFNRADITTRVIVAVDSAPESTVVVDDLDGQLLYGIEPFERTDLLTADIGGLEVLANRVLNARHHSTSPRVRSVTLDARTADNVLDLMATVDVYDPSRYRCRLQYPRGVVFDEEYFATGVSHEVTADGWTLELNLDSAAPYATVGGGWDGMVWDTGRWATPVDEPEQLEEMAWQ